MAGITSALRSLLERADRLTHRGSLAFRNRLAEVERGLRHGRPIRLLLRVTIAALVSAGVVIVAGTQPATPALIVGMATWLLLTGRHDLAPPR